VAGRSIAERIRWAVETLDPAPSDRLLEIGCGHGVAVSLICRTLSTGTIVGIDRSKPMIAQAAHRNREHVAEGRAAFEAVALADAELGEERFDKVFAVNVRLFRADATREADVLRHALSPEGALYLFQQHPSEKRTRAVTDELSAALERNGFAVRNVTSRGAGASTMTCIVARSTG
jgi:cyclopropane fatty-acyl-phospholipid synthase-like methyltransferase